MSFFDKLREQLDKTTLGLQHVAEGASRSMQTLANSAHEGLVIKRDELRRGLAEMRRGEAQGDIPDDSVGIWMMQDYGPVLRAFHGKFLKEPPRLTRRLEPIDVFYRERIAFEVPSDAEDFSYGTLVGDPHLRLLRISSVSQSLDGKTTISCELQNFAQGEVPKYECLSYLWGTGKAEHPVLVNNQRFVVRLTLATFLTQIPWDRLPSTWFWIDAVCIDQSSIEERNHFVPRMGEIYSGCTKVVIALGAGNDDIERGFDSLDATTLLHRFESPDQATRYRPRGAQEASELKRRIGPLRVLLSHPYWSRAWIMQEATAPVAQEIWYGGRKRIMAELWMGLKQIRMAEHQQALDEPESEADPYPPDWTMERLTRMCMYRDPLQRSKFPPLELDDLLPNARTCQATVAKDKLFALLGLAIGEHAVHVSYAEYTSETFRKFAINRIVQQQNLDILGYAGRSGFGELPTLPSWVPDWTDSELPKPFPKRNWEVEYPEGFVSIHDLKQSAGVGPEVAYLPPQWFWEQQERPKWVCHRVYNADSGLAPRISFSEDGRRLTVRALCVDTIAGKISRIDDDGKLCLIPYDQDPDEPYVDGWTWIEALNKTICADIAYEGLGQTKRGGMEVPWPADDDLAKQCWTAWKAVYQKRQESGTSKVRLDPTGIPDLKTVLRWLLNRCVARLNSRRLMLASENVQLGDKVYIVAGSQVPIVVRHGNDGTRSFISEAYVHGIMDGHAVFDREGDYSDLTLQ